MSHEQKKTTSSSVASSFPAVGQECEKKEPAACVRWAVYGVLISITFGMLLADLFQAKPLASGNDRSRWCTVWSLVERQTYQIDEIMMQPGWGTIDKVYHEGHFYSTKPALFPTLTAGVYRMVKVVFGLDLLKNPATTTHVILLIVNLFPFVLSLLMWCLVLERYAKRFSTRLLLLTIAGLGTFLTTFNVTLNNHTVAAFSLLCTVYVMLRILDRREDEPARPGLYFLAGFFAAFTCTNELPAAIFGVLSFLVLARYNWKLTARYYIPAALIPLGGFFLTTYLSTGGWKPFYMYYGTEKYLYVKEGIPSYWFNPGGIDKSTDTPFQYLWHCTVGHHGIFSLSPVFLLTLYGWYVASKKQKNNKQKTPLSAGMQTVMWLGGSLTLVVLGFYLTRTANYNYGGMISGLRWTFWLIPLWILAMVPACDQLFKRMFFWPVAICLLLVSMYSALSPIHNPWQHPWLFQLMTQKGMINYSTPAPTVNFQRQTWLQTLPDNGKTEWIEFSEELLEGRRRTIRLTGQGEQDTVLLKIKRSDSGQEISIRVDRKAFEEGSSATEMFTPGAPVDRDISSKQDYEWAISWLAGVPGSQKYRVRDYRYLKTRLRPEAFRCLRATTLLVRNKTGNQPARRYYCMAWWSEDVPFGTVQVRQNVSGSTGRTVLSQRILVATAASRVDDYQNPFAKNAPEINPSGTRK